METRDEQVINLISHLQSGYYAGRQTNKNERLAFLAIMIAVTKRSIPQIVKIRRSQFHRGNDDCIFRGFSPRSNKVYRIHLPVEFMDYLEDYCNRYLISDEDVLFPFNTEYVGARIRELIKLKGYGITIHDIQFFIPYEYNSKEYKEKAYKLIEMLYDIPKEESYICITAERICNLIRKFIIRFTDLLKN